jgi:hypothetical protein
VYCGGENALPPTSVTVRYILVLEWNIFQTRSREQVSPMYRLHSVRAAVPNLWHAYLWGYTAVRLGVCENNIGNGEKHQKKRVKIKAQKQNYEGFVYKERLT